MGPSPTYHPPKGEECETSVEHGLPLWAEPAVGYCSRRPRPSPMWGSRFVGARAVGPWVGEQKTLGKSPLRGNPSPESTHLPTFSLVGPFETKERVGVCGPSSCIVGTTFVGASWRITYLPSHLCLRVCARSSPFVPYHGVPMSLFPYPHPFLCCLSWCRCTPYAKRDVRGWGPSVLFLSLLPGWFHTFVGLG